MDCPCLPPHPVVIGNPPGLARIAYRVGDFVTFREALLRAQAGEQELTAWRPSDKVGDLGLQAVEWWAYLADVLTFYNERVANQGYLRTADVEENIRNLVRMLGYRPRPGIAATAVLAAIVDGSASITVPAGMKIQSKPGPGKQPQVFEVKADTAAAPGADVAVMPASDGLLLRSGGVLVAGSVTSVKTGDAVVLVPRTWVGTTSTDYGVFTVSGVGPEKDPAGATNTRISLSLVAGSALAGAAAAGYRLLKPTQSAHPWQYTTTGVITSSELHLESVVRQVKPGEHALLRDGAGSAALLHVTAYTELLWYANGDASNPANPPSGWSASNPAFPLIPIPHSKLAFSSPGFSASAWSPSSTSVWHTLVDVGVVIPTPAAGFSGTSGTLDAVVAGSLPDLPSGFDLLLEDATGSGVAASSTGIAGRSELPVTLSAAPAAPLVAPLRALINQLSVSRGETVARETIGSGDATQRGQDFALAKAPVTYLQSKESRSGDGFSSTVRIWVDGVVWTEVPTFYGQPRTASVFVTREDESGITHAMFGDGDHGRRLPTGAGNVVASYRYGSGREAPAAGTLTALLQPQPGLRGVRNPVPAGGGADPDPPDQLRRYAPRSVLTFGRAVSALDFETIAARAPGVARARAYWSWDAGEDRSLVKVYVGDDQPAVDSARTALLGAGDPNRPVNVVKATPRAPAVSLEVVVDPLRDPATVTAAVASALSDPDTGLYAASRTRIGQPIYESAVFAACLLVAGALGVRNLRYDGAAAARFDLGEGEYIAVAPGQLSVKAVSP